MRTNRRGFLRCAGGVAFLAVAGGVATAADAPKAPFEAKAVDDVLKGLGAGSPAMSADIVIKAPDIAENGAVVPVEVTSRIPNTQSIAIIAEKNPLPLVAQFDFAGGAEGYASTRMKLGRTSDVLAVVKADGKFYMARREIKVTIGGCGG